MTSLAILLIIAAFGFAIANWLKLPIIPLLIFPGILLSFFDVHLRVDFIQNAAALGLAFLLFAAGIELNPKRFTRHRQGVLWVGFIQFLVLGLGGFGLSLLLGFDAMLSLFIACALATSSTLVVLRHLKQQGQMFEPFGRLVTGVLLLQDLVMIMIIIILVRHPEGPAGILSGIASGALLLVVALLCQRKLMPYLIGKVNLDEETMLLCILALLFAFIGLTHQLKVPLLAGAFLAGLSLASFPINGLVRGLITSITDFFLAVFFTALGAILVLPTGVALVQAFALAALVLLLTPPLVTLVAEWNGLSSRASIESGLLLAQTSEFSLVLGLALFLPAHPEIFSIVALVMVFTMSLTPFLATDWITVKLLHLHPLRRRIQTRPVTRDHVLLLGFGTAGMWVVKPLQAEGHQILVVDDDPVIIHQLERSGIASIRGDGSDEKVLEQAGANQAKLIIAAMRRVTDAEKVLRHVRNVPVVVRVFETADAERIRQLGGRPILNSAAAADTFMQWFEKSGRAKAEPRAPVQQS